MFHDVKHEIDGFCRYGEGRESILAYTNSVSRCCVLTPTEIISREIEYFMSCLRDNIYEEVLKQTTRTKPMLP